MSNFPPTFQRYHGTHTLANPANENTHSVNSADENIHSLDQNTLTHCVSAHTSVATCSTNLNSDDIPIPVVQANEIVNQTDADHYPTNNAEWVNIKSRRNRRKAIVGENNSDELQVVVKKKWIHLSSFKPNVTEDQIIAYVGKRIDISIDHMICYKLVKKRC